MVETQNGDLKRPLLINGRALTAEQQQKSDKRIRQFVRNPAALRKSLNEKNQDAARSQRLLKMLPDAFHFNYGERRGDIIQLNFAPIIIQAFTHPRTKPKSFMPCKEVSG